LSNLSPTSSNATKDMNGDTTNYCFYQMDLVSYTISVSSNSSTIGLNGTGYQITDVGFAVNLHGTTLSGTTYNTVRASKTGTPIHNLTALVTATKANFSSLVATGKYKSIDITWATDVNISANLSYSINGGTSYTTKTGTSGIKEGSFTISGLSPGTSYTVRVKVIHDGLETTKDVTATTYSQPTVAIHSSYQNISLGLGDSSKSIYATFTNQSSHCYLSFRAYLSDGTAISNVVNSTLSSGNITIQLDVSTIRSKVTSSMNFYVTLSTYTDSARTQTAYSDVKSANGTITIDNSASNISFTDSNFVVTSSTADTAVDGGTLGNKLLIRSISELTVQVKSLATTGAGTLVHTVEVKNSSDNVVKSQTISNTTAVNIGSISAQGTYSVVLTITNTTYNTSKTVTISDIYVSEYSSPSVFGTVVKTETVGTYLMTFSAQYSTIKNADGQNVNILQEFSYYYKLSTSSNYTLGESFKSKYNFTLYGTTYQLENQSKTISGFSTTAKFSFRFTIKDSIKETTYDVNPTEAGSIIRVLTNGQVGINVSPDTSTPDVKLSVGGDALINGTAKAKSHANVSLAELKTDIELLSMDNITEIIQGTDVYNYKYKDDVKNGKDRTRIGFVIGEDYNTYEGIIDDDHTAIDLYSCIGLLWKSQQKIYEELASIKNKLNG